VRIVSGILGIDPGLSGALALWRDGQWTLLEMPVVGDAKRHEINGPALCLWLREHEPSHAYLEYASARPGQGVTSMFRFGTTYGATKMALSACDVAYTIITPAKWKPAVGIPTGADKEASRLPALQLFPDQAANLTRKKDHARADAMLLAYFGAKGGRAMKNKRQKALAEQRLEFRLWKKWHRERLEALLHDFTANAPAISGVTYKLPISSPGRNRLRNMRWETSSPPTKAIQTTPPENGGRAAEKFLVRNLRRRSKSTSS
jgi:crossover junction endodeoxyribonuclease RuvC